MSDADCTPGREPCSVAASLPTQSLALITTKHHNFWATICKTVRPMLSDRYPVCLSCLSMTLVYCGQMAGWIQMKLGTEVGLGIQPHCVRWGPNSPSPKGHSSPQFFRPLSIVAKMPLGTQVGLGPGDTVLDGDPSPPKRGTQLPHPSERGQQTQFSAHVCCGQMAGLIKMPLGTKVSVRPGDIYLC